MNIDSRKIESPISRYKREITPVTPKLKGNILKKISWSSNTNKIGDRIDQKMTKQQNQWV